MKIENEKLEEVNGGLNLVENVTTAYVDLGTSAKVVGKFVTDARITTENVLRCETLMTPAGFAPGYYVPTSNTVETLDIHGVVQSNTIATTVSQLQEPGTKHFVK